MAPEVIFDQRYSYGVDWWACGITFYECTVGEHLFNGADKDEIFQLIQSSNPIDLSKLLEHSLPLFNLLTSLLIRDATQRLGIAGTHEIMSHEFFESVNWTSLSTEEHHFKPAQQINKRQMVKDKQLFYGFNSSTSRANDPDMRSNFNQMQQRATGNLSNACSYSFMMSRSKRKILKKLNRRKMKEEFDSLVDKRKIWVSGEQTKTGGGTNEKTVTSTLSAYAPAPRGHSSNNMGYKGPGSIARVARSGMLDASVNWSITVLPEEDEEEYCSSSDSDEDDDDNGDGGGDGSKSVGDRSNHSGKDSTSVKVSKRGSKKLSRGVFEDNEDDGYGFDSVVIDND